MQSTVFSKNIKMPGIILLGICYSLCVQFYFGDVMLFAKPDARSNSATSLQQSSRSAKELEGATKKIFHGAQKMFKQGQYWQCAQELIIIMDFNPHYSNLDEVICLLGHCLFQEELTNVSIKMFNYLLKT